MIMPGKYTNLEESILAKAVLVYDAMEDGISLGELCERVQGLSIEIDEFILAIDLLWIMGKIVINMDSREVIYAN